MFKSNKKEWKLYPKINFLIGTKSTGFSAQVFAKPYHGKTLAWLFTVVLSCPPHPDHRNWFRIFLLLTVVVIGLQKLYTCSGSR
jgi:hypothetical protein